MFAALMQVRPRMLLDFVIVIIPKFSASTTALWATQPPPRLTCWLLVQAPTTWPHTLRCTLFSEGLFWIINFIPQLVLSQNPFENLLSIVDSLADKRVCANAHGLQCVHWRHGPRKPRDAGPVGLHMRKVSDSYSFPDLPIVFKNKRFLLLFQTFLWSLCNTFFPMKEKKSGGPVYFPGTKSPVTPSAPSLTKSEPVLSELAHSEWMEGWPVRPIRLQS